MSKLVVMLTVFLIGCSKDRIDGEKLKLIPRSLDSLRMEADTIMIIFREDSLVAENVLGIFRTEHCILDSTNKNVINYRNDGSVVSMSKHRNDKVILYREFWPNGNPFRYFPDLSSGFPQGKVIVFYPNANIYAKGYFADDKRRGTWTFFSESGKVDSVITYDSFGEKW